jgi:hypothetical protein
MVFSATRLLSHRGTRGVLLLLLLFCCCCVFFFFLSQFEYLDRFVVFWVCVSLELVCHLSETLRINLVFSSASLWTSTASCVEMRFFSPPHHVLLLRLLGVFFFALVLLFLSPQLTANHVARPLYHEHVLR